MADFFGSQRDIATVLSKSGNKIMLDSNSLLLDVAESTKAEESKRR